MMLFSVVLSGYLGRVLPVPLPLVQISLGAVIAGFFNQGVTLEPDLFLFLFLPPLLFLDGWRIPKEGLLRDKWVILELALGLVVFTVVGAGFLINWLIPSIPLPVAFALAAILSPTDPVAVSSIAKRVPIPRRLMHILSGESLLNDASGLVCFRFAVAAAMTGSFSLASASLSFLWVAVAGLAIGAAFTFAITTLQRWLSRLVGEEGGTSIIISLLIPFGAYLLAESLQASGILAAVSAGFVMGYVELSGRALASTRLHRAAIWDMLQFVLNGAMFVLLGEQLPKIVRGAMTTMEQSGHSHPGWLAVYAIAITLGLILLRMGWVLSSMRWSRFKARYRGVVMVKPNWRLVVAASFAGVRGAITLAGVMTLPLFLPDGNAFPARDLVIFLAAAVILLSLILATVVLPPVLSGLVMPDESIEHLEKLMARRETAAAAIIAIEKAHEQLGTPDISEVQIYADATTRVMADYKQRIDDKQSDDIEAATVRRANDVEGKIRLIALQAERESIYKLVKRHLLSDATARKLVRQLDLIESRLR